LDTDSLLRGGRSDRSLEIAWRVQFQSAVVSPSFLSRSDEQFTFSKVGVRLVAALRARFPRRRETVLPGAAMRNLCLTEWRTVSGDNGDGVLAPTITQAESAWLDVGDSQDVVFFLEVKEATTSSLSYQTCPSKEDAAFQSLFPAFTLVAGTRVDLVLATYAFIPVARYVRWQLSGTSHYDATFRIHIAAI
jgi:hypothetical protein